MATLSEDSILDAIEVSASGLIQVRRVNRVLRDGVVISSTIHRDVLEPGDALDGQDAKVSALAKAAWTDDVVASWKVVRADLARLSRPNVAKS